jgi:beta-lactamase class A
MRHPSKFALCNSTMAEILHESSIVIPAPQISTLWAFRTALVEAGEVVFDLQARFMSSYGALTPEAQQRLNEIAARLMRQIELFTRVFNDITQKYPQTHQHESEAP